MDVPNAEPWLARAGNQRAIMGGTAAIFAMNRLGRARENMRYGEYGSALVNVGLAGASGVGAYHAIQNSAGFRRQMTAGGQALTQHLQKSAATGRLGDWGNNLAKGLLRLGDAVK